MLIGHRLYLAARMGAYSHNGPCHECTLGLSAPLRRVRKMAFLLHPRLLRGCMQHWKATKTYWCVGTRRGQKGVTSKSCQQSRQMEAGACKATPVLCCDCCGPVTATMTVDGESGTKVA